MRLAGKIAVVTGGSSGIGLGIAREFAAQGAKVVIFGRRPEALAAAATEIGPGTLTVAGDVGKVADLERLYQETISRFGGIDILVANAGVARMAPLAETDEAAFDLISEVNFKGTYFTVQRALPHLRDGAAIILVTSAGNVKGIPGLSAYVATKAAVRSLARSFAAELLPRGIRVNALAPGPVDTPMFATTGLPAEAMTEFADAIIAQNPMGRFGRPEEMAKAALFLASADASYLAGSELVADGGFTQL